MTTTSPTEALTAAGVSIWLDDLSRERIRSGGLQTLIDTRNVVGITTNPTIFANALTDGHAYAHQLAELASAGSTVADAVFAITTADVAAAADVLRPVYNATAGRDGWVSIEVSPGVAHDAAGTLGEAERLIAAVDRPNVYIKIPATIEGLDAIAAATALGISINVTLIFGLDRYRAVIDAYLSGLERAHADGRDLSRIRSVASFFVSRVDTEVDARLRSIGTPDALSLLGRAGVANARLAYSVFEHAFASERARLLLERGAHPQRPLWASTGVKDPSLPDTMYVVELVAPNVVNTMPGKTLEAVFDHAVVRGNTIVGAETDAQDTLDALAAVGVSYDDVTAALEREGVEKFAVSWSELGERVRLALDAAS